MPEQPGSKLLIVGTTFAYLLIGLEVLFMITPFALFFYSVYGPILKWFASSPATAWLNEFFLPHMIFVDDPLLIGLSYLQALFAIGLLLFLAGAIPLYYGRLRKKGVVSFGPYARLRHPQYLSLALSGFGLMLYWPRFLVLIFYVTMLFVYYLLARNEEWRMKREQPGSYQEYMDRTWMFVPGEPGGKLFRLLLGWIPSKGLGLLALYLVTLGLSVLAALGLRAYTLDRLPQATSGDMHLVSVYPRPADQLQQLYGQALESAEVRDFLQANRISLAYLMPGDFFLTGLLLKEGPRFSEAKLKRYPHLRNIGKGKHDGGLVKFFRLGYKFFRTIGTTRRVYDFERIIFTRASEIDGSPASSERAFAIGVVRNPALVVDIDFETGEIVSVQAVSGQHSWGELPMPVL
ncbi:methyltransferase family protein [Trichloromonas sp.]|uniref:methyltransferase family protein n=1 Tax=Trichloromonas sp. TaxID=3069249 RepID=UPI003D819738